MLELLCDGLVTKEIAAELKISPRTVEAHKTHMMKKFFARSLPELIAHVAQRRAEVLNRLIVGNFANVVWALNFRTGKFSYVSGSIARLRGYKTEEVMNQTLADALTPESLPKATELIEEQKTKRKLDHKDIFVSTTVVDLVRKDQSAVPAEITAIVAFDEKGQPAEMIGIARDISDCKQAEEKVRASEQKFMAAFTTGLDALFLSTLKEGKLIELNDEFEHMFGYVREEIIGRTFLELNLYCDPSHWLSIVEDVVEKEGIKDREVKGRKKNGDIFTASLSVSLLELDAEPCLLGVIKDVTERRWPEKALQLSEKRYRTVFENTGAATVIVKKDDTISLVNAEFERLSGYARDEIEGKKSWTAFVAETDLTRMRGQHRLLFDSPAQALRNYEFNFVPRTGETRQIYLSVEAMPEKEELVASLIDVTERKKAGQALKESEEKYRSMFENAVEGIFQTTPDGRILSANPTMVQMCGYESHEQLVGSAMDVTQIYVDPKDWERLRDLIKERGFAMQFEARMYRKNREIRWVSMKCGGEGRWRKIRFYEGSVEDITDRKRAEEDLRTTRLHLSDAADLARIAYWEYDEASQEFIFNDAFYALYATTADQEGGYRMASGEYVRRFVHPEDVAALRRRVEENRAYPRSDHLEQYEHRASAGTER